MASRAAVLVITLLAAPAAHAAWFPVFDPSYIQVRPGETLTLTARGAWLSGISVTGFPPMTFSTEDPSIATIEGSLPTAARTPVRITGHRPGVTRVHVHGIPYGPLLPTSALIVVAEQDVPMAIAVEGLLVPGSQVKLTAVTDAPDATFTWFSGRLGGIYVTPVSTGRELTVTPKFVAPYEYWVLATTPNGAGAAGVVMNVMQRPSRRRRARH